MDMTHLALARAVMDARLASARERHLAEEVSHAPSGSAHRTRPPPRLVVAPATTPQVAAACLPAEETTVHTTAPTPLAPALADRPHRPERQEQEGERTMQLDGMLQRIAERIVENGTPTEAPVLQAMASLSRQVCPGAAAALVDWDGTETARLRAFGIVHGVVLEILGASGGSLLLDEVRGAVDLAQAG
jgi:hypothetical protein